MATSSRKTKLKKNKKLKRLTTNVRSKLPRLRRRKDVSERYDEAVKTLPKITDDTLATHREQVLSGARRYIYPLAHSKHRIVKISITLIVAMVVLFFAYSWLALYKLQSSSGFIYGVTQVIPFPVAKVGSNYVAYENYLFQLRHYKHYYETQQQVNFNSKSGKQQLDNFKKQAMADIINYTYVKQLAAKNHVSVSNQDVNNEISLVRNEDRLGNNSAEFREVLSEFWGWSVSDFKKELRQELLAQKVVSKLDTATQAKAQQALSALQGGADFAAVAAQYSDDTATKANGGQFGFTISKDTKNISPQTLHTLLSLKPGQISGIINLGGALEIDKVISNNNGQIQAAHILFDFKNINTYIAPLKKSESAHIYIKLPQ